MMKRTVPYLLAILFTLLFPLGPARAQGAKQAIFAVLLDNTPALRKRFPQVQSFGAGVVRRVRRRGPVALFDFARGERDMWGRRLIVSSGADWGRDEADLSDYIEDLSVVDGSQADLYGAVGEMVALLDAKAAAEPDAVGDKVIILVTSGLDTVRRTGDARNIVSTDVEDNNRKAKNRAVKLARESRVRVYAVGFTRELDTSSFNTLPGGLSPRGEAEEFLRKLTKETGGRVVFPRAKETEVERVLDELLAP